MKAIRTGSITWSMVALLGSLVLILSFGALGCTKKVDAPKAPLVFSDLGWDSAQVHNRIAAFILEHGYGYGAEYIAGDTIPMFAGLERGDIDITMEIWVDNQQPAYDNAIAAGKVVDLGANFPDSWQGWLVPTYMIKGDPARGIKATTPDLKSVMDLPKYKDVFKDHRTMIARAPSCRS